jgi:hypothetical protein
MWGWKQGYPRKELGIPIQPAYGMGSIEEDSYEMATPVNPIGAPVWSEIWQQRVAGALKRNPLSMDGCGCGGSCGAMGDWGVISRAVHGTTRIPISLGLGALVGLAGARAMNKNMLKGAGVGAAASIVGLLVWFNVLQLPHVVPIPDEGGVASESTQA